MRIAMISEHASPLAVLGGADAGGQNMHVAALSAELAAHGHEVRVYTRREDPDQLRTVSHDGYEVVHVPAGPALPLAKDDLLPHMGSFARFLAEAWRVWRPGVAHAHFWMSGLAALGAGRPLEVPVVQTFHALGSVKRRHQGAADTSPARRVSYERIIGRLADRVVVQCQDEVDELLLLGVPRERMSLVPSGVDLDRFRPDGPARPRGVTRRILTVGRLVPRKGFEDLIEALARVPDAELVIAGGQPKDEPYARHLRVAARAAGVGARLTLAGSVPNAEMPPWYRSADVVAATPWYEPFGLTPLEAMACGRPMVGTAVGGIVDTVVDGVTGDLVPPRETWTLGTALRRILAEPERRCAYGAAALDRARSCYSWHRVAARLLDVYATVTTDLREAVA